MSRILLPLIALIPLLLAACASGSATGAPPPPKSSQGPASPTLRSGQAATPQVASAATAGSVATGSPAEANSPGNWRRPLDAVALPPQGEFHVVSQTPAPGEKVRVFFLGAQF